MNLKEAIDFTFKHREAWSSGKGAGTARINSGHCLRILGNLPIESIETKHFTLLSSKLAEEGKAKATINRVTAALSTIITELRQHGYKLEAPVFKRQKESRGRLEYFTSDDINNLLAASISVADNFLLFDSIMFASKTGCRQGEMLGLTDNDIDFENQTITFRDVKTAGTTGIKDHIIKMHPDLVEVLERRMNLRIGHYLFDWRDKDQLLRAFKSIFPLAGITKPMTWHHLRHTVATQLVSKNVPLRVIMGVLNHTNINTTLRYSKAMDTSVASAIDLL